MIFTFNTQSDTLYCIEMRRVLYGVECVRKAISSHRNANGWMPVPCKETDQREGHSSALRKYGQRKQGEPTHPIPERKELRPLVPWL